MQITIHDQGLPISDEQQEYIYKKISNLGRYGERVDDESTMVRVDIILNKVKTSNKHITFHITMVVPQGTIRAEVDASTVQEGVDLAVDKLKKQIERYKERSNE